MKVYYNGPIGIGGKGGVFIAANSQEEAVRIWNEYEGYSFMINDDFEEVEKMSYDCETPQVFFENWDFF